MLRLACATDPAWGPLAAEHLIPEIMLDHAHLEKRAAAAAVGLMFRYPDHPELMDPLSRLAREELAHFEEVFDHLKRRGVRFGRQRPSGYAEQLSKIVRRQEPDRLLDALLVAAFIEARSCERMRLLAENLDEPELEKLYRGLLAAEARHHGIYVDLARRVCGDEPVRQRLPEVAAHEAKVISALPAEPRLHSNMRTTDAEEVLAV